MRLESDGCRMSYFFFSSRRRHTRCSRDWSSDVCSSDLFRAERLKGRKVSVFTAVENLLKAVVSGRSNSSFIQYLKEPYAIVATEPHPQHGLLQAHPLVAISSRHAPHLLLPRIPRGDRKSVV